MSRVLPFLAWLALGASLVTHTPQPDREPAWLDQACAISSSVC